MTISRRKGCPDILRTDCRNDQGMETAWKQVTQVIENGMKPEDIEKMVSKLTKAPDHYDWEHNQRVGLRAAERYCLGKLLTGETESPDNTSGRWDPLKNAITSEFKDSFTIKEVYNRLIEYFGWMTETHHAMYQDIRALLYYGPGYHQDMSKNEMLKAAMSKENRYWTDDYKKRVGQTIKDFEAEVAKADVNKYKFTTKDQERVDVLMSWLDKNKDKSYEQAEKIGTVDKAVARYILGLKAGHNFDAFRRKALDLGATKPELEALARKYTGKGLYKICFEENKMVVGL